MRKLSFTLLLVVSLGSQGQSTGPNEPIGQRFGLSPIEVVDSVLKEGVYKYSDAKVTHGNPTQTFVQFRDDERQRVLSYSFEDDKCDVAMLTLPLAELDSLVRAYTGQFPTSGKQMWRGPHGLIKLIVAIGNESVRRDHKPHITVFFDSRR